MSAGQKHNKLTVMITDKELAQFIDLVDRTGRQRRTNFGKRFNESDFVAGASCLFASLGISDLMPVRWIASILTGNDPFAVPKKEPT